MNRNNNNQDDNDSKRLKEVIGRNQTRNMAPPFSYANQPSEQENIQENTKSNNNELEENQEEKEKSNSLFGGSVKNNSETGMKAELTFDNVLLMMLKKYKWTIIISIISVLILLIPLLTIITSSEKDRILSKDLLKKFSSVTSDNDASKIDEDDINTEFPPIGSTDFETYFSQNVHEYLVDYLSNNGYCEKATCASSDAYVFFKRYLKVLTEFEKKSYKIDSGLLYETIAYDRADEEMFSGSVQKQKTIGWIAFIKSLFSSKTDEISKLANKFWREIYIFEEDEKGNKKIVGTEWVFSLDKYVGYLMYGDSMHDTSGLGTDKDLDIEAISSTKKTGGNVVSGSHSYKYSGCTASDSIYEGVIEDGYIYNRFKDTDLVNVLDDREKLEKKIVQIIQNIFDDTVETYGNPNYCSGYSGSGAGLSCGLFSIKETKLNKLEFVAKVNAYAKSAGASAKNLAKYASDIYEMGIKNNVNPEMVYIRASVEGYSPGKSSNNYWGIGCSNKCPSCCRSYPSVMKGVEAYIKNISQYNTVEAMAGKYAYIGDAWYAGSSSDGGCYYFKYIANYYDSSPEAQASKERARATCEAGGNSSVKTTEADQIAYARYQSQKMVDARKKIFNLENDTCDSASIDQILNSNASIGEKAAKLAVAQFDNFGYSQDYRMSDKYVDCSSLVYRTYKQLGIDFGGATSAGGELGWCRKNNRMISNKNLQPGDLLFRPHPTKGAGHVEIYIGNGKIFGAHDSNRPWEDQVSITTYNPKTSSLTLFCRPY